MQEDIAGGSVMDFDELLARARAGDLRARDLLLERLRLFVRAFFRRRVANADSASDLTQDVQLRMAFLLIKAKQTDKAVPLLKALADRGTKAYDVYTALARIAYEKDDLAGSEAAFVKALAVRDDGRTWFNLGVVRVRRSDFKGALDAFEHAAQHAETKEQAAKEIEKVKSAQRR